MKSVTQFENKKVLVLGLAKSGEAAARLLAKLGAIVTVNDGKPFEENPSAQALLEVISFSLTSTIRAFPCLSKCVNSISSSNFIHHRR